MKGRTIIILVNVVILAIINWKYPLLRFTNYFANDFFALIISIIPIILLMSLIFKLNNSKSKLITVPLTILLTPFCLLSLVIIGLKIFTLPTLHNEQDPSFKKLYQIEDDIAVYRSDGGATTAYFIEVRQEKLIFPGLVAVRVLYDQYGSDDLSYKRVADRLILIDPHSNEAVEEVEIKPLLYF